MSCGGILANRPLGMQMEDIHFIKNLLVELVAQQSAPELGARLKQRLNLSLKDRGIPPFDEQQYGSNKFSTFITTHLDKELLIERHSVGDIRVSLNPHAHVKPPIKTLPLQDRLPIIKNDVWQAFTNPDPDRKRYFNRKTLEVLHYIEGEQNPYQEHREANVADYISVEPFSGETQRAWMIEFIDAIETPESILLKDSIPKVYSSHANTNFTRSLGARSDEWRRFRTLRIIERIKLWALANEVNFNDLLSQKNNRHPEKSPQARDKRDQLTPKEQAKKLIDLLDDEEVIRIAIPTLLDSHLKKIHP